jgi:hypothetical protein
VARPAWPEEEVRAADQERGVGRRRGASLLPRVLARVLICQPGEEGWGLLTQKEGRPEEEGREYPPSSPRARRLPTRIGSRE